MGRPFLPRPLCKDCGKQLKKLGSTWCKSCVYSPKNCRPRTVVDPRARFWIKVDITQDPDDCWRWLGAIDPQTGYGKFGKGRRSGGTIGAHQFSFLEVHDFMPDKHEVCHSCDNRWCVNPRHLSAGTRSDNVKQSYARGRR